jgi:hypothetical protein
VILDNASNCYVYVYPDVGISGYHE